MTWNNSWSPVSSLVLGTHKDPALASKSRWQLAKRIWLDHNSTVDKRGGREEKFCSGKSSGHTGKSRAAFHAGKLRISGYTILLTRLPAGRAARVDRAARRTHRRRPCPRGEWWLRLGPRGLPCHAAKDRLGVPSTVPLPPLRSTKISQVAPWQALHALLPRKIRTLLADFGQAHLPLLFLREPRTYDNPVRHEAARRMAPDSKRNLPGFFRIHS